LHAFLDRPLTGEWPYLWLDATYLKQREGGRIVSVAAIIAVAANSDGRREIVGLHIGPSEAETFWSTFLRSLARRGIRGVKLVISDAHQGLTAGKLQGTGAACFRTAAQLPRSPGAAPRLSGQVSASQRIRWRPAPQLDWRGDDFRNAHDKGLHDVGMPQQDLLDLGAT
jgi:putative transposase